MHIPIALVTAYTDMLPVLHSDHQLGLIEAASVPHMTDATRKEIVRRHARAAGAETVSRRASASDLAAIGITVEEVPPA